MRIEIKDLATDGWGIGHQEDGKVIFVQGALPGEIVEVEITQNKKSFSKAKVTKIVSPSKNRIDAFCPYFLTCGGCDLQHLKHDDQIVYKKSWFVQTLRRIGRLTEEHLSGYEKVLQVVSLRAWSYRGRARLEHDGESFCYHRSGSSELIPIEQCAIVQKEVEELFKTKVKHGSYELRANGAVLPLHQLVSWQIQVEGKPFWVAEFSQPHVEAPDVYRSILRNALNDYAGSRAAAVDLYAGSGLFSTLLDEIGFNKVTAIESSKNSAALIAKNDTGKRIQVLCQEVEKVITDHCAPVVIADPPRAGLSRIVAQTIANNAEFFCYVSCDPATFARDVQHFLSWKLVGLWLVDAFPQTHHYEVIGVWKK